MTIYRCEGGQGCMEPCTLNDHQEDIIDGHVINEPNEDGFCRFTGEPKHWGAIKL